MSRRTSTLLFFLVVGVKVFGDVGDPQIRTDHPWYPGELAISTFDRLFATQAEAYERATGRPVDSDESKALASWLWRNTHYWHGEAGRRDLWGEGLTQGKDMRLREYWNGLFGYGFGLCGTTHSQWTAELDHLLGHARGRGVGVAGHNSFEVFLQGGAYGSGRWALLDHDLSTVIFDESGRRLLGIGEVNQDVDRWISRGYKPERQRGWLVCGLHPSDGNSYRKYAVAEYLAGYAGPPPMLRLRRGERMRRYFEPGLEDGKTFVFWGRNYNTEGIPGPERSRTWVNQPEKMHGSVNGTPHRNGQARFANVEYVYRPDFTGEDYREGIVGESANQVTFSFQTPYVIGATPPNDKPWGIYDDGCRNGLVLHGKTNCPVSVSLDDGRTWTVPQPFRDGLDLTDLVKGRSHYWLRFGLGVRQLRNTGLAIRTVCQANVAILPRLKDTATTISFEASGKELLSIGPELNLAKSYVTAGGFGEKEVTLSIKPNRPVVGLYASAHVASGSPPNPKVRYYVEYSLDEGAGWLPVVKGRTIPRRGDEPGDFWSQSFSYGFSAIRAKVGKPILIRFRNDGGKRYLRAEAHLVQTTGQSDPVKVTYAWNDSAGERQGFHVFRTKGEWELQTGRQVRTRWVEFEPIP
ncbi:MAG: hypothetical protein HOB63_08425 [Opitutae bacterium]|nr:hypothetical protein [Opitutae bacterium]